MAGAVEQGALDDYRQRWHWPAGARLAPLGGLHLTLHFLGATEPGAQARLQQAMTGVRIEPMVLTLGGPLVWPGGITVLQVARDPALNQLHDELAAVLRAVGLTVSAAPWVPHLTLARRAAGAIAPPGPVRITWPVEQVSLVWSRPSVVGYQVVARWPAA